MRHINGRYDLWRHLIGAEEAGKKICLQSQPGATRSCTFTSRIYRCLLGYECLQSLVDSLIDVAILPLQAPLVQRSRDLDHSRLTTWKAPPPCRITQALGDRRLGISVVIAGRTDCATSRGQGGRLILE
ncbi:MAG: hypothetical protein HLUCCO07_02860 [Rhodobacteraceae bacterium HLUCCO07]|nr:MAG: hypothetical protein HLUCCO07_02860 [Rhodobacteraceae bacterium HLUCCO07]